MLNNESKTLTVELTNPSLSFGAGLFAGIVEIEYDINDIIYGRDDGKGDNTIADSLETIITINENGWTADVKR